MAIIKKIKETLTINPFYNQYPDQFASDKDKLKDEWIKQNMDYWFTEAVNQFKNNERTFARNYKLINGFLDKGDFYQEEKMRMMEEAYSLLDTLEASMELPAHVKNYTIMKNPINTMTGEMSKRPDNAYVKAFDDQSQGERMQALTDMFQQYTEQMIREKITMKLQAQEVDTAELEQQQEQIDQITEEEMTKFRQNYSSIAEKWGSRMLETLKVAFSLKEKSEEGFRDLLISAREFFHVYPDNSKLGFACDAENPKNVWYKMSDNKKYTRDAFAAGTVHYMEISEIIHKYPFLTKEEIDLLNEQSREQLFPSNYTSPLVNPNAKTGPDSIQYDTYDPLVVQRRWELETHMLESELADDLGIGQQAASVSGKFTVVKAYWSSKKQIGKLVYLDEQGNEVTEMVDSSYKKIPEEISIEWGYINQWYEGLRIGEYIYYVQPLEILQSCPIIGVVHEAKNTPPVSLVDLMKPFQMIFNVCMNQLWHQLETEMGRVFLMSKRHIPNTKDGDNQDAIDEWELEARERGYIFIDDSPDNTKVPSSFNQYRDIDLTKSQQMITRRDLAIWAKDMCWELVGISRQRAASTTSSETATSINTALTQSYAQTENYFVQHEYLCNQVYQAVLDAAMYIETQKPQSTVHNITDGSFITVNRDDIALRDLMVFVESRAKDQEIFRRLTDLAQPMLQNGADFTLVAEMFMNTSVRQQQENIRQFQKKRDMIEQQGLSQKQQDLEQQQAQFEAQMAEQQRQHQATVENDNFNKAEDRLNKREIAIISALGFGQVAGEDADGDGVPDLYEMESLRQGQQKLAMDGQNAVRKAQLDQQKQAADNGIKREQISLQRDKMKQEEEKMKLQDRQHKEKIAVQKMAKKSPPKKK